VNPDAKLCDLVCDAVSFVAHMKRYLKWIFFCKGQENGKEGKHCHKTLLGQMTSVIGLSYLPVWQLCEARNLVAIDDRCT
jgi:hypothetical protein